MDLEYSKAVGAAIRAARLARGMTQEQLAAKAQPAGCDLTRSALAKIECGQRSVYPDEVKVLHEALHTNIFLKRLIIYRPLLYNEDGDEK